ncbi:hypothetical protein C0991_010601 [Blastosporella zonata]|nr:hypothetical protein C0991_010601 [Blastosporella zonata]
MFFTVTWPRRFKPPPDPFPQEILEIIVAYCPGKKELSACSLTASSLRDIAQRNLFSSVSLLLYSGQCPGTGLDHFLASNERIASYVRILRLSFSHYPHTPRSFPLLTELHSLSLYAFHLDHNGVNDDWVALDAPYLKAELFLLMQSPSLQSLELRNTTHFPLASILGRNPAIKDLQMSGYGPLDITMPTVPAETQAYLESLRIVNPNVTPQILDLHDDPLQPLSLSRLRDINAVVGVRDASVLIQRVLDLSATTLRVLELVYYANYPPQEWNFLQDFSSLYALTTLTLPVVPNTAASITWCCHALESIPQDNSLGQLTICIFRPLKNVRGWRDIDTLLSRERHVTVLRKVRVEMFGDPALASELEHSFDSFFPKLAMKGVLVYPDIISARHERQSLLPRLITLFGG